MLLTDSEPTQAQLREMYLAALRETFFAPPPVPPAGATDTERQVRARVRLAISDASEREAILDLVFGKPQL